MQTGDARLASGFASAPRVVWMTLAAIVATVNLHAPSIIGSVQSMGWVVALSNLLGLNAIVLFAIYGLWTIGQEESAMGTAGPLSRADVAVLGIAMLLSLIPWHIAALGALLMLGGWGWITGAPGSADRRAALVMLAIASTVAIGRLVLHSVGDTVVGLDAHFVGWLAGMSVRGNVVDFVGPGSRSFIIGLPCSSVHNMSQAVLLWATVTQLLRLRIDAALAGFALLAMLGLFLVNAVRLVAIAWYPAHFDSIHNGLIGDVFGLISLIVAALIVAAGALHAHRRQS